MKYLIIDIDGTLTDGGIYYDNTGNEMKKFCTRDAAGIICASFVGINIIALTGRESVATIRRLTELGVKEIYQGIKSKKKWLESWMLMRNVEKSEIGYIGDDINDVSSMKCCGYIGCPADAAKEVRDLADYVSPILGGYGAVRDVIEHILRESGEWDLAIKSVYDVEY